MGQWGQPPWGIDCVYILLCIGKLKGKAGAGKPPTKGGEGLDLSNSVCIYVLVQTHSAGDTGSRRWTGAPYGALRGPHRGSRGRSAWRTPEMGVQRLRIQEPINVKNPRHESGGSLFYELRRAASVRGRRGLRSALALGSHCLSHGGGRVSHVVSPPLLRILVMGGFGQVSEGEGTVGAANRVRLKP